MGVRFTEFLLIFVAAFAFVQSQRDFRFDDSRRSASARILFQESKKKDQNMYSQKKNRNELGKQSNESVLKAIVLITEAIEKIDLRLRRVEETLGQINLLKFGEVPYTDHIIENHGLPSSMKCQENFVEVGNYCIFASVFTNHRANWEDARAACQEMGAELAEVLTHSRYVALSTFLSSTPITAGYSYWIGGIYPGATWIWLSNGKDITLNPNYWTEVRLGSRNVNVPIVPGDIRNGRCLGYHYTMEKAAYRLSGDECGYEKFYLCQTNQNT